MNSDKAIAQRINKELKRHNNMSQMELLKEIIKFKNPEMSLEDVQKKAMKGKGNFSTALKGTGKRSISIEDLYIISKKLSVPLEYIWFGEEKKTGFIPKGARYVAYQDNESDYREYVSDLEDEKIRYHDEFGYTLFDYFGEFESINGYRFFVKNYSLHFEYMRHGELTLIDSKRYLQNLFIFDDNKQPLDNLVRILAKYNDVKTFREIFFNDFSLNRFDPSYFNYYENLFSDDFLNTLLNTDLLFESLLKIKEIDISIFQKNYEKGTKRFFVEPMLYEMLNYAFNHEEEFKEQLSRMLDFALQFSKQQYEFISEYISINKDKSEHGDVYINRDAPRFLLSSRYVPMGSVIKIRGKLNDDSLNNLIKEIDQYVFNMTHIINPQEKTNEEIKISTPDNPLFKELNENAKQQKVKFIPTVLHSDKEFTYFQSYETSSIDFAKLEHLKVVIDCLVKVQDLVANKPNKVLVHGDLNNKRIFMFENGNPVGIAGWQKCHYGSKYEDRVDLIANIEIYPINDERFEKFAKLFDVVSQGFNQEEKKKLIDKTIAVLTERRKSIMAQENGNLSRIHWLKDRASKLELFKEFYFK